MVLPTPIIFDRQLVRARQRRAAGLASSNFLVDRVAEDLSDRLTSVLRRFECAVDLGTPTDAARRALAAARNIVDGGSLTVIATATEPVGGETTIITLDRTLTRTGRFPALDLVNSGTLRPELLVGDAGADAIAQARAQALGA